MRMMGDDDIKDELMIFGTCHIDDNDYDDDWKYLS